MIVDAIGRNPLVQPYPIKLVQPIEEQKIIKMEKMLVLCIIYDLLSR